MSETDIAAAPGGVEPLPTPDLSLREAHEALTAVYDAERRAERAYNLSV